jgi:signal-transduction protein with cAMP-binding, CBS, and nucleotidyltransferase domain
MILEIDLMVWLSFTVFTSPTMTFETETDSMLIAIRMYPCYFISRTLVHGTANIHHISLNTKCLSMYNEYAERKAGDIAETNILVLDESTPVADAAKEMRSMGVSSALVSQQANRYPVGIVTERDIVYRVVAEHRSPYNTTMKAIMSSPLLTIEESVPVKDAVGLMRKNDIRRLPVIKNGEILGILTLKSIVGNSHEKKIELLEVEVPTAIGKITCPYCESKFDSKSELSMHIDRLHLGSGLLEGDLRQW